MRDEPFIVSSAIDSNIFGMHTEQRFVKISRDYSNDTLAFTTRNGSDITMKFYCERKFKDNNCAHVYVQKATILKPQAISLVESKLKDKRVNSKSLMVLNASVDMNVETSDLLLSDLSSKRICIPVRNNTDDEIILKHGYYFEHTSDVEDI